jgi:cytochrome c peroxidase
MNPHSPAKVAGIRAFLGSLTGTVDAEYIARPALPESGPQTPKADPS